MSAFDPLEDRIDVLHEDLGAARRRLDSLQRAPFDSRVMDPIDYEDTLGAAVQRVAFLERELAGEYADRIAGCECEGFECVYCGGAA